MNDRRKLLVALGASALAVPFGSFAQQGEVHRLGLLSPFSPSVSAPFYQAFRLGLRGLGWVEGKNIVIEYRYAEGKNDRLPDLAAELVRLKVDIIVTSINPDALAAKNATRTIPIVMAAAGDPVTNGLVESLARPGGNITGLSQIAVELGAKRLALLKEMVPGLSRVAVLWNPQTDISALAWKEIQLPAQQLGIELQSLEVWSANDFDMAFEAASRARVGALAIMPGPVFRANLKQIANLAAKNHLPSIYNIRDFAEDGGLVTYGPDRADLFRRAAIFVDKILKGAKPADLPVEQATKFELVINMKTARSLGITIPQTVLARASRVIE
jgi:putative tryptophan/tyrosine transport system substrate-binding protein